MRHAAILMTAAVLTSCATTPVPLTEAKFIPDQLRYRDDTPGTVPIVVRRDRSGSILRYGCKARVFIDGDLVGYLGAGEAVALNMPAGDAIVGADPGSFCQGGTVEQAVTLMPGKPIYLRVAHDGNGSLMLMRTLGR